MSDESPESDELFGLLSELVDAGLTPPRAARLRELLRDDPAAQDLYLRFMRVHAQLHLDYDAGSGPADMPGGFPMPPNPPTAVPLGPEGVAPFAAGPGGPGSASPARSWLSSATVGWTLAALLAIGLFAALRSPGPRRPQVVPAVPVAEAVQPPPKVDVADGVAVVIGAKGVRWEMDGGRAPKEGDVLPKGRLSIREGRATFAMLTGVMVVVEGPADLELVSVDRIACHRGKLRARVPEGAEGFIVSGPGTAVVDMGTEFGINIKGDGKSRGQVFEGEVEAGVLGTSGAMRHSRIVQKASGGFEIDPESGLIGPLIGPEDFAAPFRPSRAELALDPGYRGSVLASRPTSYWRFESQEGGRIANEVAGGAPLLVTGPIRLAESAAGNRCAAFGDGQHDQHLRIDGAWEPARRPGYAIELWFLPEMIGQAALVSLIAPKDTMLHLSLVELTASGRRNLFRPASIRFLYRWPTSRGGGDNVFSDDVYVPYRWHHLVAQVAGERMELYLDGVVRASQAIGPGGSTTPCQVILGRLTTLTEGQPIHHTGFRRPFVGLMDEVALYDRPLTSEEIQAHYRLAIHPDRTD